jgi:DNA-binding transcriptional LysR family regulator
MDWSDLRLVLALLTEGNLKAAARSLELDYSTVCRRVQRLEAQVGGRLYVRLHGQVQPTALGRELAERTREIERLLVRAPARVFHQGPQSDSTASVTGCSFSGPHLLPLLNDSQLRDGDLKTKFV